MSDVAIVMAVPPRPKRIRKYGVAPLPSFDFASLPDGMLMTTSEVASVLRKAPPTVAGWRRNPDHPLKWEEVNGLPRYTVGAVRNLIAGK